MSYAFMYWFTRLDSLHYLFFIAATISISIFLVSLFICTIDDIVVEYRQSFLVAAAFILFLISGAVLIPTQKEAAAILLVPKIVNNEKILNIADGSLPLVELKLREWASDVIEESANE